MDLWGKKVNLPYYNNIEEVEVSRDIEMSSKD